MTHGQDCDCCARHRLDEREVERRDELLAGADADLKAEREKTAALRALLAEAVNELQFDGLSTGDHFALIERIRKELGK